MSEPTGGAGDSAAAGPAGLSFGADAPLDEVMRTMRAMRRLKPDPVPRELLERLVEAASLAPSGGNNQSFDFVIVDDREQMARLAELWRKIVSWYVTTQSPIPPPTVDAQQWSRLIDALRFQAEHFAEVPAVILACYQLNDALRRLASAWRPALRGYRALGVRDSVKSLANMQRFIVTGEAASIYPGVQNLLLTARALGLGANLTTWHTMFEQDFKAVLGIPRGVHVYAIVPVGYPRGRFGPVRRRPVSEAIHWNAW